MVCSRYPKECKYYENVLKRKCFEKLKHNVWENKTKWKLIQKADFHFRVKLLRKYLDLWLMFLNESFWKRINLQAANSLYEEKLKSKGIYALRQNAKNSSVLAEICRRKIEGNLKFRTWHQWKHYTQKRLKIREIKLLANKIRKERIIIKFLYLWSIRFKEKQFLQTVYEKVAEDHNKKLKQKYINIWTNFRKKKKFKREIERLSAVCYEDKLKEKTFLAWKEITTQKITYRNQTGVITSTYQNYLLKNYLNRWFLAYEKLSSEKEIQNTNIAIRFHNRRLLQKVLKTFNKVRLRRKFMKEKESIYKETKTNIYISFYLHIWTKRVSEKYQWKHFESKADKWRHYYLINLLITKLSDEYQARVEERERILNVVKYSNAIITHKVFKSWQQFVTRKTNKRAQNENAKAFYCETVMQKYFLIWKKFVFLRSQKKVAISHYEIVLLCKSMNHWKTCLAERKIILEKVKNMETKHKLKLTRKSFQEWKTEVSHMKQKIIAATDFHRRLRLSDTFAAWKKYAQIRSENKFRYNRNKVVLNEIIIKNIIDRWKEIHSYKLNLNKKIAQLKLLQSKRLMTVYFQFWYNFVDKVKNIQQAVDYFSQLRSGIVIEQYLICLSRSLSTKRLFKRKEELAKRTNEKLIKRKYIRKWILFISWKRERVLRCVLDGRKVDQPGIPNPPDIPTRRKPIIPSYLKADFSFEKDSVLNERTFTVLDPVNKQLPVIGGRRSFEKSYSFVEQNGQK